MNPGVLYIVATPIGNLNDITLRALEVLRNADAIICEETRQGSTLLKKLGLPTKELIPLNEHNEAEQVAELAIRILQGQSLALVSDCGTPVFADPGQALIHQVVEYGLQVVPIPGPSSLMATLSILDFKIEQFVYGGFLPRDPAQRRTELQRLRSLRMPIVLLDTPYRLTILLEEIGRSFGKGHTITLAFNLTLPGEAIYRGTVSDVLQQVRGRKGEFVLVIH
jgi:16S rRNA (cytidine1402-2'-O)-methyltransferase